MKAIYMAGENRVSSILLETNAHLSFVSAFVYMTCAIQTLVACGNGITRLHVGAVCPPPCPNQ